MAGQQQQQHDVSPDDGCGSSLAVELLSKSKELATLVDRLPALPVALAGSAAAAVNGFPEGAYSCVSDSISCSLEQVCLLLEWVTQALRARLQPAAIEASQQQQLLQLQDGGQEVDAAAAVNMAGKRGRPVSPQGPSRSKKRASAWCTMRQSTSSNSSHSVVASRGRIAGDRGSPIQLQHGDCTTIDDDAIGRRVDGGDELHPLPSSTSARTAAFAVGCSSHAEQHQDQQLPASAPIASPAASSDDCDASEPSVAGHQQQLPPEAQTSQVAVDGGGTDTVGATKPQTRKCQQRQLQQPCNSPQQSYPLSSSSSIGVKCPTCGKHLRASALPVHTRLAHGTDVAEQRQLRASRGGRGMTAVRSSPASRATAGWEQSAEHGRAADERAAARSGRDEIETEAEADEAREDDDVEDEAEREDGCELSLFDGVTDRVPAAGGARDQLAYSCALCVVPLPRPPATEPPDVTTPSNRHSSDGGPLPATRRRTFVAGRYDRLLQHVRLRHLTASGCTSTEDGAASGSRVGAAAASLTADGSSSSSSRAVQRGRRDLLACPDCGRHLKLGGAVKNGYQRVLHHMWAKHGRPLPDYFEYALCDRCDYRTYSGKLLKDHQAYRHGSSDACRSEDGSGGRCQRAVCPECGKQVVRAYLKRHVRLVHAIRQATGGSGARVAGGGCEQLTCQQCGKSVAGAHNLARHVRRVHARQRDYLCHLCSQQFYERKELHAHLFARHGLNASGRAELACDEPGCAFRAIHREVVAKHRLAAHVTAREYPCGRCDKAFKTRAVLKQHDLLVHGRLLPPPEADPQLPARGDGGGGGSSAAAAAATPAVDGSREDARASAATAATAVSDAAAIAAGADSAEQQQRPQQYSCPHCPFTSHARQYLQRHVKIHSAEKRYRCDVCRYESHFLENVKKHKRNVHEKRAAAAATIAAAAATHRCSDDAAVVSMQQPAARSQIAPADAAAMIPNGVLDALALPAPYECQLAAQLPRQQSLDIAEGRGVVSAQQQVFNGTMADVRTAGGFGQLQQQLPPIAVAQHDGLVGSTSNSVILACASDGSTAIPLLSADRGAVSGTNIRLSEVYDGEVATAAACDGDSTCTPVAPLCLSSGRLMPQVVTLAELSQPFIGCVPTAANDAAAAAAAVTVGISSMLDSIAPLNVLPSLVGSGAVPSPVLATGAAEPSSAEEVPAYPETPLASIAQMPLLQIPFSPELHM